MSDVLIGTAGNTKGILSLVDKWEEEGFRASLNPDNNSVGAEGEEARRRVEERGTRNNKVLWIASGR